ncbi:hypothetical protein GN316_01685 [Xylophilus sp. Kf1]|nr:hypothetical protein [Xylophilus sp. Kf1]
MHGLDRRSAARRANDQAAARADAKAPAPAESNRRRSDRRASPVRRRMASPQLAAIQASVPPDLAVVRVTYVVDGPCIAWVAEVDRHTAVCFLVGSALLSASAETDDALEAVIHGVRARISLWEDR